MCSVLNCGLGVVCSLAAAAGVEDSSSSSHGGGASQPSLPRSFVYERASPAARWPSTHRDEVEEEEEGEGGRSVRDALLPQLQLEEKRRTTAEARGVSSSSSSPPPPSSLLSAVASRLQIQPRLGIWKKRTTIPAPQLPGPRKLSKLALQKAKDWKGRVERLSRALCQLELQYSVADVLQGWPEQLAPTDLCFVVKTVGHTHWQRALELYEWLNMRHWYTPNPRMLATILGVLGRSNQPALAQEIFSRAEPELGNCVQVYNAMMSVHARHGRWNKVQPLLVSMREKGCEPDLITFNIIANARTKEAGGIREGMATTLLREIHAAGLQPDAVTYNTLISACSANQSFEEARAIFQEMKERGCDPDIWTYNTMISVFGRSGMDKMAEDVFQELKMKGFIPDAITFNSILFAYARNKRVEEVEQVLQQMEFVRCHADEITYNTIIDMYGNVGLHEKALSVYHRMKDEGCVPDAVTYTVLIDVLGKGGLVLEAEQVFAEMVESSNVNPTLHTFSAMICGYAKAGMYSEAARAYAYLLRVGIRPDLLLYSVMLDLFHKAGEVEKAIATFKAMVNAGLQPSLLTHGVILQLYREQGMMKELVELTTSVLQSGFDPALLCSTFVKAGLWEEAGKTLKMAMAAQQGDIPPHVLPQLVQSVLNTYAASARYEDAQDLIHSLSHHHDEPQTQLHMRESLILMLARAEKLDEANKELRNWQQQLGQQPSAPMYKALLNAYEQAEMPEALLEVFQSMHQAGLEPDFECCQVAGLSCCKVGDPQQAQELLRHIQVMFGGVKDSALHIALIKAFGKQLMWEKAQSVFKELQLQQSAAVPLTDEAWNALLGAYAASGQYELVRQALDEMVRGGWSPTDSAGTFLVESLCTAERPDALPEAYRKLEELGLQPNRNSYVTMIHYFIKKDKMREVTRVYREMCAAGFILQMHMYKMLLGFFTKSGYVQEAEAIVKDMKNAGYEPDVFVYNAMISLYSRLGSFQKASQVFQGMQVVGCAPDTVTYNTLIGLYSKNLMTQEALAVLQKMHDAGCVPDAISYGCLIWAYGRLHMWEAAVVIFSDMEEAGCKPTESTFHAMIDVYRRSGKHEEAENLVSQMRAAGFEPSPAALHMLMDSFGKGGKPERAAKMFESLRDSDAHVDVLHFTALIDAYLRDHDYKSGVKSLTQMGAEGLEPNYITWTCVISAASRCEKRSDALMLLAALRDTGCPVPLRLLIERIDDVILDAEDWLENLQESANDWGQGMVNVLEDLLWAFKRREAAAHLFHLAVNLGVYPQNLYRVEHNNWTADFRKLSAGAALVALTQWLSCMQEASLEGIPESSKMVTLITGTSKRSNAVSLCKTLKAHLWEIGSPFLTTPAREGALIAKGHSLRMWLKDSPYCVDMELRDSGVLPEVNTMQVYNGAWMRVEMIPVVQQIEKTLGDIRPKKFSKLARMGEEKRTEIMVADIEGSAQKQSKLLQRKGGGSSKPSSQRWKKNVQVFVSPRTRRAMGWKR